MCKLNIMLFTCVKMLYDPSMLQILCKHFALTPNVGGRGVKLAKHHDACMC